MPSHFKSKFTDQTLPFENNTIADNKMLTSPLSHMMADDDSVLCSDLCRNISPIPPENDVNDVFNVTSISPDSPTSVSSEDH